jgi:hypothetical protein
MNVCVADGGSAGAGGQIVYYTAALGVVMNVVTNTQRFFHGHTDNIKSMACHPNDWIIATGQTKKVGPEEVPYCCIWETRECKEVSPPADAALGKEVTRGLEEL